MLIRFTVENFLSFRDEVEFSMVAGKGRTHRHHIVSNQKRGSIKALKAAVLYGANASGKSNLIKAIQFAKNLVVQGTKPRSRLDVKYYKFDAKYERKPSKFEFEFRHKSKFFIYGFTLDRKRIHTEWLYEIIRNTEKVIFERETSAQNKTRVKFSNIKYQTSKDEDFLHFAERGTRPNQLFLTQSMEQNIKYFEDVFNWFAETLVIITPEARRSGLEIDLMTDKDFKHYFEDVLHIFDTGISGIHLTEVDLTEKSILNLRQLFNDLNDRVLSMKKGNQLLFEAPFGRFLIFVNENDEVKIQKMMTIHEVKGVKTPIFLEVTEESDGTRRLFDLIPGLIELFNSERVFIVDELDRSLHPQLSYSILGFFFNRSQQMSQLIVTTHESSLLDLDLLRRDEIWFLEKDKDGASSVYSLEEFAPRHDKDIQKGYLLGRFGAIPIVKNINNIKWAK